MSHEKPIKLSLEAVETCVLLHALGDAHTSAARVAARLGLHPAHVEAVGVAFERLAQRGLVELLDGEDREDGENGENGENGEDRAIARVRRTEAGRRMVALALGERGAG